jgi:hypothetical protein
MTGWRFESTSHTLQWERKRPGIAADDSTAKVNDLIGSKRLTAAPAGNTRYTQRNLGGCHQGCRRLCRCRHFCIRLPVGYPFLPQQGVRSYPSLT